FEADFIGRKFRQCAEAALNARAVDEIADIVAHLDQQPAIDRLMALARGGGIAGGAANASRGIGAPLPEGEGRSGKSRGAKGCGVRTWHTPHPFEIADIPGSPLPQARGEGAIAICVRAERTCSAASVRRDDADAVANLDLGSVFRRQALNTL